MVTASEIRGQWNQLKGQIKERWGEFTDNEFTQMQGNTDQLIGVIQKKTGTARQEIEKFLSSALQDAESTASSTMETARQFAAKATDTASKVTEAVRGQYSQISNKFSDTCEEARGVVRSQPGVSVGVAFAAGIVGGAILGILMRPSR